MELIGTPVKSIVTGKQGVIAGLDKKNLLVSFTYGGVISLPVAKYSELLEVPEEARAALDEYIESLKPQRKNKAAGS